MHLARPRLISPWRPGVPGPDGDNVAGVDQDVETRLRGALRDALKTRDLVAALAVPDG